MLHERPASSHPSPLTVLLTPCSFCNVVSCVGGERVYCCLTCYLPSALRARPYVLHARPRTRPAASVTSCRAWEERECTAVLLATYRPPCGPGRTFCMPGRAPVVATERCAFVSMTNTTRRFNSAPG